MKMVVDAYEKALAEWLSDYSRLVLAGVGNPLRGDDGLGVEVAARLAGRVPQDTMVVDCGTVPESHLGPISRYQPSHILFLDAADLGLRPGRVRLIMPEQITGLNVSTHNLPMSILTKYLRGQTRADIAFLVIQPSNTGFGEDMSPEVVDSVRRVAELIERILRARRRKSNLGGEEYPQYLG
ncbi:hydrogenase maturation peptidase HycI [Candidatus Bathyarchaeota archaeon]|nr:hydrogenase maturation peptidase HycI [Candidatus Bathyarchaeota archaeon]